MNFATKTKRIRILVWFIWFIALLVYSSPPTVSVGNDSNQPLLMAMVSYDPQNGPLFPWPPRYRWKQQALRRYQAWRRAYRRAKWAAGWARLALGGVLTLAQLVEWLTSRQQHYQVGALPVLYALLETLQVRQVINRHCPTKGDVDHGTVAIILVLNRLMFPLPLYQVADWVGRTVLGSILGVPAAKFNDDRLARTLDALYPHLETIWLEVVEVALRKADVDLSVIFYDLTAFITHGRYAHSEQVEFGFAHNTPMNKRKFKLALNVTADGHIPWLYHFLPGRTADQATVADNMNHLAAWLKQRGYRLSDTLVIGDRAMLDDELAWAYDQHNLRYLGGLRCLKTEHKALVTNWTTAQLEAFPLEEGDAPPYWGRGCRVAFQQGDTVFFHKGLVILSGPMRAPLRQARQAQLTALTDQLTQLRDKLGQPYHRTLKAVQKKANGLCRLSKVGDLMTVAVYETVEGVLNLHWQVNQEALYQAEKKDGRYLLVTNDWSLSHQEMLSLYRAKDGVEKRFTICKSDLKVSPVYLHQDKRIASMLCLNMVALLAYSLLERQVRQAGVALTTRQIIKRLETLTVIETHCHDGSSLRRLTPVEPEIARLLQLVAQVLDDLIASPIISKMPLLPPGVDFTLSPMSAPATLTC
ncbi:MAG: IS1634 family transposase [Chloroflexi bacterium]|nr:IS1634 family transposase [Chloroflexota bacterium]